MAAIGARRETFGVWFKTPKVLSLAREGCEEEEGQDEHHFGQEVA